MARWVNDRLSGNMSFRGGNPSRHVVRRSLDTLTREAIQNTNDQGLGLPILVDFTLIKLEGKAKASFLKALDWRSHKRHLEAATLTGGGVRTELKKGIHAVGTDSKALFCLRIDDFYTRGLEGDEFDRHRNFNLLCRAEFVTPDRPGRGGSYGLGKAVLWRFSQISTVLFSSTLKEDPHSGLRLFGRADIPSHDLDGEVFDYGGFFGEPRTQGDGSVYANSIWNDTELATALHVCRDPKGPTGTTALIVGFFEPQRDEQRFDDLEAVAADIAAAAETWFWPVLAGPNPSLHVNVYIAEDGSKRLVRKADPSADWASFISAFQAAAKAEKAKVPDDVSEIAIPFEIVARTEPEKYRHPKFSVKLRLRATRGDSTAMDHKQGNTIAYVRGSGMVVKYEKIRKKPIDDFPIFAVLKVGTQLGNSDKDERAEEFFRNSEPPLHNNWTITDTIRDDYQRGAGARLAELENKVQDLVREIIEENLGRRNQGPQLLSREFTFGGGPGYKKGSRIRATITESDFSGSTWLVSGRLENTAGDDRDWRTTVTFLASAESGAGDPMEITGITVKKGVSALQKGRAVIKVEGSTKVVDFTAEVQPGPHLSARDAQRTAIVMSHSSSN